LEAGKSYTLRVKLRAPKWAGSNIYWDGSRLTFDPYQEDGSLATRKGYEGVYFRFGSLVGISPVGDFDGSTVVYIPDNSQATKWRASTAGGEGYEEWKRVPANLSPDKEQIPYMDNENYPAGNFDRSDSYVIDAFQGDPALMYPELRGDICQYLSKTGAVSGSDVYRLPTSTEFGTEFEVWDASNPIAGGWKVGGTESDAVGMGSDPGTYDMIAGGFLYSWNSTMGNVTLSSSGFRDCDTGILEFRGYRGSYWSGSAASNTRAYHLYFSVISMRPTVDAERSYGFSVRCVKN
jgi:hypothetical protein